MMLEKCRFDSAKKMVPGFLSYQNLWVKRHHCILVSFAVWFSFGVTGLNAQPTYRATDRVEVHFDIETTAQPIQGTVELSNFAIRGVDGLGRFRMDVTIDGRSINTGDIVVDRLFKEEILQAEIGPIRFASTDLVPLRTLNQEADSANSETDTIDIIPKGYQGIRAGVWSDQLRGTRYHELTYSWKAKPDGRLHILIDEHIPLARLGFKAVKHPFIQTKGSVHIRVDTMIQIR